MWKRRVKGAVYNTALPSFPNRQFSMSRERSNRQEQDILHKVFPNICRDGQMQSPGPPATLFDILAALQPLPVISCGTREMTGVGSMGAK